MEVAVSWLGDQKKPMFPLLRKPNPPVLGGHAVTSYRTGSSWSDRPSAFWGVECTDTPPGPGWVYLECPSYMT